MQDGRHPRREAREHRAQQHKRLRKTFRPEQNEAEYHDQQRIHMPVPVRLERFISVQQRLRAAERAVPQPPEDKRPAGFRARVPSQETRGVY